jgi:predicted DNA-binding antitoxin AbrB/MazE fold protein
VKRIFWLIALPFVLLYQALRVLWALLTSLGRSSLNGLREVSKTGQDSAQSNDKPSTTLPGTVEKIIKPIDPREPEKAQIYIEAAEDLYREIRIDNTLKEKGEVALKEGARVDVTVEADKKDTAKKAS